MEKLRLFVAIELPDDAREELGSLQGKLLKEGLDGLKWVSPNSLHITLKFLGYTELAQVEAISEKLDLVSRQFNPFDIGFKGLGVFPALSRAQVLWVGLTGELGRLQMVAGEVEENMTKLGFQPEKRRFTPHLTLARARQQITPAMQRSIAAAVSGMSFSPSILVRVASISLMSSQLSYGGATYSRIHSARLRIE
ncbi:MAG: RNA 2',3'-cyclic phosphodiesterase [Dehalococcoidales bacterium]|nr:RNA 2',3'-cyclic phosphodiesterase [Dehalococcoidales bacterium]MDD3264408.1 RNA 2',3'-cyclic phosphodiesterase [Dehalococcoidales bacterium]MDD4321949.1 RNA 2',3'-cyclic phosphodiesterase [Dehalococcoidales bacterium]MDD4794034.1 RNA 2',3'-cyclic phosphodiesterase [Dehalococcoidales bacterium]MDD5122748.1 RNA 2',3'-cyclic phosphodiesterase [Dehalococcoidales bacterium]